MRKTVPTVRDRVVQTALRHVLELIFEETFAEHSYGFRPGRGCKDALRQVMQKLQSGHYWVVDADIRSYFDRISHSRLRDEVNGRGRGADHHRWPNSCFHERGLFSLAAAHDSAIQSSSR